MAEGSLYERLGGVFAIAAVIDHFSDAVIANPAVGKASKNPELREWSTNKLDRLPGLKFMRTLWVCNVAGGPLTFAATKPGSTPLGLEEAHRELRISPEEFDELPQGGSGSVEDGTAESSSPANKTMFPSSFGMTFCVCHDAQALQMHALDEVRALDVESGDQADVSHDHSECQTACRSFHSPCSCFHRCGERNESARLS